MSPGNRSEPPARRASAKRTTPMRARSAPRREHQHRPLRASKAPPGARSDHATPPAPRDRPKPDRQPVPGWSCRWKIRVIKCRPSSAPPECRALGNPGVLQQEAQVVGGIQRRCGRNGIVTPSQASAIITGHLRKFGDPWLNGCPAQRRRGQSRLENYRRSARYFPEICA